MKETRRSGTEKANGLWQNLTKGILNKINKSDNISNNKKDTTGDMGDTHTPISRLDLTGMNREQAKELINKIIDEKLEMISQLEMPELKIDYKERERQRAKAAERISERRNRRKHQVAAPAETIVAEHGVYSDFKHSSVFDVIQPEAFPYEESKSAPIEGQLSILDVIAAEKVAGSPVSAEFASSFDPDRSTKDSVSIDTAEIGDASKLKKSTKKDKKNKMKQQPDIINAVEAIQAAELETAAEAIQAAAELESVAAAEMETTIETIQNEETDRTVQDSGFSVFGLLKHDLNQDEIKRDSDGEAVELEGVTVSTAMDEAVDRLFAFYGKNRTAARRVWQTACGKTGGFMRGKIIPALADVKKRTDSIMMPFLHKTEDKLRLKAKAAGLLTAMASSEGRISDKAVIIVDALDRGNDVIFHYVDVSKDRVCRCVNFIRNFAENNKKKLLIGFGAGVAAAAAVTIVIGNMTAYEYIYNGKVLGVVKNQEDVYKTIDIIGDKLSAQYDADITIDKDKDIRFNKVVAFNQEVDDREDVLNRLTYMRDMKANGKGIFVDGKLIATLESEKTAKAILDEIKSVYLKNDTGIEYIKIGFAEDVVIKEVETKLGSIEPREKALEYMMTGAVEKRIHLVQSGETFSEIAKMYGLKQSELKASNPDVIPEKLSIGQEICLNQIVPLVTVQTTEIAEYIEEIPYEIQYENTASLFKNEQTVKSKGTNGQKDVVAEIVRNNGIEVGRKEISATILSEPVSQVVLVGTKDPPPLIGTGTFIYPIRGTLTSRYGTRWGRLHAGIDLAAPIGTRIKAADGGKVTFAGYNGALGYMVAIDHGGGRETWYGHCSKLFVKKGDRVYQGQHIANVGNTGRSTGPHVHFEVHINGKTKNPLNYL